MELEPGSFVWELEVLPLNYTRPFESLVSLSLVIPASLDVILLAGMYWQGQYSWSVGQQHIKLLS